MKRLTTALVAWLALVCASAATAGNYLVVYKQRAVPADAAAAIERAGGSFVYSYPEIGVAIASSEDAGFRDALLADTRVDGAAPTAPYAVALDVVDAEGPPPGDLPNAPATDGDTFSALQWDMRQIKAPEAHAVTGGSRAVLVGDIDTGLDFRHPDLAPNVDFTNSVSCLGGIPNQAPAAWDDDNGHGTHTAGTIAAASNGIGIVGTAPNVRLAAIKTSDPAGFFFPEAVVCAFMWAGTHGFDAVNNSYFADPFQFNCKNDPVQHAIWKAEQRAIHFALLQGVTVVASAGNSNFDLTRDPPEGNECVRIPSEIEGVVTVSANGNLERKAFYSNYGVSVVDVVAPGGDSTQLTPQAPNGRVLSTWPAAFPCLRSVQEPTEDPAYPTAVYCYLQGTSMAAPHATGTAALIVSRFGDAGSPQNGKLRPGEVAALLAQTADPRPCPPEPTTCHGGTGYNAYFGHGQVDALAAVTHDPGR
jgi:subtilisin family serine protease